MDALCGSGDQRLARGADARVSTRGRRPAAWRRYLRFWGSDVDADVRDELAFHLDMRAHDFERQGMTPQAAQQAARERFGDVGQVDASLRTHDRRRDHWARLRAAAAGIGRDFRHALRTLRRAPAFTAAAILCLALGTGATAAVFAIVDAFLLRPFPAVNPGNLVVIASTYAGDATPGNMPYPDYLEIRAQHAVLESAVAGTFTQVSFRVADRSERRIMEAVSENYWEVLGVHMALGRPFSPAEALHGDRLLVIGYRLWQTVFAGAADVLGRSVSLNGIPMTVVGVAPPSARGLAYSIAFDAWFPATVLRDLNPGIREPLSRDGAAFRVLGRLQPGVTSDGAEKQLELLARALERQYPTEEQGLRFVVAPEIRARPDISVAGIVPRAAFVFSMLTVLVLLIACANVASLILTRASGRQTELAVRLALGAPRLRLIRELLAESLALAAGGAVVGLALAAIVVHWVTTLRIDVAVPVQFGVRIDWGVVVVTAGVATGAAVVSGLGPAIRSSGVRIGRALNEGARGLEAGVGRQRFRAALVAAQVAVSFLLLVTAGLFVRSVQRAGRVDLGFRQDHEFMATVDVALARYDSVEGRRFFRALVQRASDLPGVRSAALGFDIPLGTDHNDLGIYADLPTLVQDKGHTNVERNVVTPRYFSALGIRLLRGRVFEEGDDSAAPRVMVINAAMAARLWPRQDPVGQRVRLDLGGPPVEIVGVVATVTSQILRERPVPMAYLPFRQWYEPEMTLHLLTTQDPKELARPVRAVVASLDPNVAPYGLTTMTAHLRDGVAFIPVRIAATVATGIGVLGLLLATIGLYGVIAYSVAQRRREIGIRMAIGATSVDILISVIGEGMLVSTIGLAAGCVLGLATTHLLSGLLVDVSARDPLTFCVLGGILAGVTFVASWVPARRAARTPPAEAIGS